MKNNNMKRFSTLPSGELVYDNSEVIDAVEPVNTKRVYWVSAVIHDKDYYCAVALVEFLKEAGLIEDYRVSEVDERDK